MSETSQQVTPPLGTPIQNPNPETNQVESHNDPGQLPEKGSVPTAKVEERVSPKLLAAIREQKKAMERKQALDRESAQLAQERAKLQAEQAEIEKLRRLYRENPMEALKETGTDYTKLTEMQLAGGLTPEHKIDMLQRELEEFRSQEAKWKEDQQKQAIEEQQRQVQRHVDNVKQQCINHIKLNQEKYPYLSEFGAEHLVFETVAYVADVEKKDITLDEASKMAEDYVKAKVNELSERKSKLSKPGTALTDGAPDSSQNTADPASNPNTWASLSGVRKPTAKPKPALSAAVSAQVVATPKKPGKLPTIEEWLSKYKGQ